MKPNISTAPKIAVLLAVYNGMQYLEAQIASIQSQIDVDMTIYTSIDKSTDGSEAWLESLAKQQSNITILPTGLSFGSAGKNFFHLIKEVDFTPYDYLAFADQDDIWHHDKLINAITTLIKTKTDAYSSNVTILWPDGNQVLLNKAQSQKKWDFLFEAAGPGCTYVMTNKLMRAIKENILNHWEAHQKVSLHDWYCYAFARANGFQWHISDKPSMLYRQHTHNEVGVNKGFKAARARIGKIKNGWWLSQSKLIAHLIGFGEDNFVKSWDKLGRFELLYLSRNAFECRRKRSEQWFFLLACFLLSFTK